jgi:hypothetical protein
MVAAHNLTFEQRLAIPSQEPNAASSPSLNYGAAS